MTSRLQKWHVGKLGLLWAWGLVLMLVAYDAIRKIDNPFLGFLVIAIGFAGIPIALSVLTWRWLGGREQP